MLQLMGHLRQSTLIIDYFEIPKEQFNAPNGALKFARARVQFQGPGFAIPYGSECLGNHLLGREG